MIRNKIDNFQRLLSKIKSKYSSNQKFAQSQNLRDLLDQEFSFAEKTNSSVGGI